VSSFITFNSLSAFARRSLSSASSRSARPQVQSLQARLRRPVLGWHSGAGSMLAIEIVCVKLYMGVAYEALWVLLNPPR
jgi:hypothetical protein